MEVIYILVDLSHWEMLSSTEINVDLKDVKVGCTVRRLVLSAVTLFASTTRFTNDRLRIAVFRQIKYTETFKKILY